MNILIVAREYGSKLNVPANSYYLSPIRNFITNCHVS